MHMKNKISCSFLENIQKHIYFFQFYNKIIYKIFLSIQSSVCVIFVQNLMLENVWHSCYLFCRIFFCFVYFQFTFPPSVRSQITCGSTGQYNSDFNSVSSHQHLNEGNKRDITAYLIVYNFRYHLFFCLGFVLFSGIYIKSQINVISIHRIILELYTCFHYMES